MSRPYVVCADTGSTFTKAAAVVVGGVEAGRLLATAAVPTTVGAGQDVLTGLDAAVAHVVAEAGGEPAEVRVCSSAGGGLRLAVRDALAFRQARRMLYAANVESERGPVSEVSVIEAARDTLNQLLDSPTVEPEPCVCLHPTWTDRPYPETGKIVRTCKHCGAPLKVER